MIKSNNNLAEELFGHAQLGAPSRTPRLVKWASDLAQYLVTSPSLASIALFELT